MQELAREVDRAAAGTERVYCRLEQALEERERKLFVLEKRAMAVRLFLSRLRPRTLDTTARSRKGSEQGTGEPSRSQTGVVPAPVTSSAPAVSARQERSPLRLLNSAGQGTGTAVSKHRRNASPKTNFNENVSGAESRNCGTASAATPMNVQPKDTERGPVRLFRWADRGYHFLVRPTGETNADAVKPVLREDHATIQNAQTKAIAAVAGVTPSLPDWNGILAKAPPIPPRKDGVRFRSAPKAALASNTGAIPAKTPDMASLSPTKQPQGQQHSSGGDAAPLHDERAATSPGLQVSSSASRTGGTPKRSVRFAEPEVQMSAVEERSLQNILPRRQRIVTKPAFRQRS
jgi:hypothetical protein